MLSSLAMETAQPGHWLTDFSVLTASGWALSWCQWWVAGTEGQYLGQQLLHLAGSLWIKDEATVMLEAPSCGVVLSHS